MIPDNEFSEHCTGDMPTMDSVHHYMMCPEESDFPNTALRQQRWWKGEHMNFFPDPFLNGLAIGMLGTTILLIIITSLFCRENNVRSDIPKGKGGTNSKS